MGGLEGADGEAVVGGVEEGQRPGRPGGDPSLLAGAHRSGELERMDRQAPESIVVLPRDADGAVAEANDAATGRAAGERRGGDLA